MRKYRRTMIIAIVIIGIIVGRAVFVKDTVVGIDTYFAYTADTLTEPKYTSYYESNKHYFNAQSSMIIFNPLDYQLVGSSALVDPSQSRGYNSHVIRMNRSDKIVLNLNIPQVSLYQVEIDYLYEGTELFSPKFGLRIDQNYPFYEARQLTLPIVWQPEINTVFNGIQEVYQFQKDRYESDVQPRSSNREVWLTNGLYDASFYEALPLEFLITNGFHQIEIESRNDGLLIGEIRLVVKEAILDYQTYYENHHQASKFDRLITLEAEYLKDKSDPSIKLYSDKQKASTPESLSVDKLNAIDAYTWDEAGRSVTWDFFVENAGLYQISFKYIQYRLVNVSSFRQVKINGVIPFEEVMAFGFPYARDWKNITLGKEDAFWFYLEAGMNTITLTSILQPYKPILETIETVMKSITNLSIQIQQLTGGNTDSYRDWDLVSFIPNISQDLNTWADELEQAYRYGHHINNRKEASAELLNLKLAYRQLRSLAERPNQIPNRMTLLSEGTKSVSQYLGDILLRLSEQPLGLEKFYLSGDVRIPNANANFFENAFYGFRQFISSFGRQYVVDSDPEKTIDVWVNRPRANIDLMQKMVDELYTEQSGIHVNLSLMPNPTKLILSNAANIEPDVAMGVSSETPFNFAIRNAAQDLREFEGYDAVVENFAKGSMLPYIYEEGVYGFPETQDFYVTFYRTDIFSIINADIPETWDEVIQLMPQLRRMGMNYYIPLSSSNAYKSLQLTAPFFYQHGANLYHENGIHSNIDSEAGINAMRLMTDLFTVYDLPVSTASFYNSFRYGILPIGISNSQTYLQLLIAAPEIKGNWDIKLFPGIYDSEKDEVIRYSSAPTQATMIFKSSDKKDLAFDFLSWWHSTEIQSLFSNDIQKMFGKEYMWFSSNLNVLDQLPIDRNHKDIIIEQLSWAVSPPNTPGGYYLEREISNAWNKVVISDQNLRSTVDEAVKNQNRELLRKMSEFGYVRNGVIIKNYPIPTLANIDYWLKAYDRD